jgi:hypothetical protein
MAKKRKLTPPVEPTEGSLVIHTGITDSWFPPPGTYLLTLPPIHTGQIHHTDEVSEWVDTLQYLISEGLTPSKVKEIYLKSLGIEDE